MHQRQLEEKPITYQWRCIWVCASLKEPEERIDRVVLLIGLKRKRVKIDITRVLLLRIKSCDARIGSRLLVGDGDAGIDGRLNDGVIGDRERILLRN